MDKPINRPTGMPLPNRDPMQMGFWEGAAQGRLDIQRCDDCGAHRYPCSMGCTTCGSMRWGWDTLPGSGSVVSYVWIPDPGRPPGFPSHFYNVAVIELDGVEKGPVRIISNVLDAWNLDDLRSGMRVELSCVKLTEDMGLPCFTRAGEA